MAFFAPVIAFLGSGTVLASLANAGIAVGLNFLASKIKGSPKQQKTPPLKAKLERSATASRSIILGERPTAGSLVYDGRKNGTSTLVQVIALADFPTSALQYVYVDSERHTITAGNVDGFNGKLRVRFHNGSQTTADATLVADFASGNNSNKSTPQSWASTAVGKGITYVVLEADYDEELFPSHAGTNFMFQVRGVPLYDPRNANNVFSDRSTWTGNTENPILQIYAILRGLTFGGKWQFGGQQIAEYNLDTESFKTAATACEVVEFGSAIYRSSTEFDYSDDPLDVIDEILTTCNGSMSIQGGRVSVSTGIGAPIVALTDADVIITEPQNFVAFSGSEAQINGIIASYLEPEKAWNTTPIDVIKDVKAGDRDRITEITLNYVKDARQAQRLATLALREHKRSRKHQISLLPKFDGLKLRDVLQWTSADKGYNSKHFRVDGISIDAMHNLRLDIIEVDPDDFNWQSSDYNSYPVTPNTRPIVNPTSVSTWNVTGEVIAGSGQRHAAIKVTWLTTQPTVSGMKANVYKSGLLVTSVEFLDFSKGEGYITQSIVGEETYDVTVKYSHRNPNKQSAWSALKTVTTPTTKLTKAEFIQSVNNELDNATAQAAQAAQDAQNAQAAANTVQTNLTNAVDTLTLDYTNAVNDIAASTQVAQDSAALAVASENDAGAHAAAALNSKNIAATKATEAGVSAVSATTSKNTAVTKAGEANASAVSAVSAKDGAIQAQTAAQQFSVTAESYKNSAIEAVVGNTLDLSNDDLWTSTSTANPRTGAAVAGTVTLNGRILPIGTSVVPRTSVKVLPTRTLKLKAIVKQTSGANGEFYLFVRRYTHDYSAYLSQSSVFTATTNKAEYEATFEMPVDANTYFNAVPFVFFPSSNTSGSEFLLTDFTWEDVTDLETVKASASITQAAVVDLENNAAASITLRAKAGTAGAELELVSASDPTGATTSVARVNADNIILNGSVSTEKLTIGTGSNLLTNPDFLNGFTDWTAYSTSVVGAAIRASGLGWAGATYPTFERYQDNANASSAVLTRYTPLNENGMPQFGVPASAGLWYEASAYISSHRCLNSIRLRFQDAAGNILSAVASGAESQNNGVISASDNPDLWPRLRAHGQAPSNTAFVTLEWVKSGTDTGSNSYGFMHKPMLSVSHEFATVPAPYSAGGTTLISGDKIMTGAVTADKITVGSLSALSATLGILKSAPSGERVEIEDDRISVFDASGVLRVRLGRL